MNIFNGKLHFAVLVLAAGVSWAEITIAPASGLPRQTAVLKHPDLFQGIDEVEGKVEWVDLGSRVIVLKDSLGHSWKITVGPQTPITDITQGNLKLSDLGENQTVHIYFDTREMAARHIDRVSPGFLGAFLTAGPFLPLHNSIVHFKSARLRI